MELSDIKILKEIENRIIIWWTKVVRTESGKFSLFVVQSFLSWCQTYNVERYVLKWIDEVAVGDYAGWNGKTRWRGIHGGRSEHSHQHLPDCNLISHAHTNMYNEINYALMEFRVASGIAWESRGGEYLRIWFSLD